MKLDDSRRSDNVEDDRGGGGGGGGIRGLHLGLGGTVVVIVIGYFMGVSPSTLLGFLNGGGSQVTAPTPADPAASAND
ncbi:MAG TPA: neutral zinc metallopeptidase, partial [Gemmataceae bacterium]|nr:neutral zinc metallopeptidase [Gemmataceae bacterium]